jgi:ribonuclease HI
LGAHLTQRGDDGKEYTIRYEAKGTDNATKNTAPTDLELSEIVFALEKFRQYILGTRFILYTDHQQLVKMIQSKEMHNGARGRKLAKISEFSEMEILNKPGKTNLIADTLSRIPTLENYNQQEIPWTE